MFHALCGMNYSDNKRRILENTVFIELKRKGQDILYYSDGSKNECVFVIKQGTKIQSAIQVCYNLHQANEKREIEGLLKAMDAFQLKSGLILTFDQEDELSKGKKKIKIFPVWKWMM